jgi:uncharacterized protein
MSDVVVTDNPDEQRFEARIGDQLAGIAAYIRTDELIVFTHTEVDPGFEGQGVGSTLVRFALDAVRTDGARRVLPQCPFVKAWILRHPDYRDLVYSS